MCLSLFKNARTMSLFLSAIIASILFLHLATAFGGTLTVGNYWKYQATTNASTSEMKMTVIGEMNLLGVDGVAVIEQYDDSDFCFIMVKEFNGTVYRYNGNSSVIFEFLSGPVGTTWSVVEKDGTEQYEIIAIEDVQVPAGFFPSCYKIANPKINLSDGSLMSYDERWWYPGTGYIKFNLHIGSADQQQMVLTEYKINP